MTLRLESTRFNITEPDFGEFRSATVCFTASFSQPTTMNVTFHLELSNMSTASVGNDFVPIPFIVIPSGSSGSFRSCIDFTVVGDNFVENDEIVQYDILPLGSNRVEFPFNLPQFLAFNIIDNDGM